MNTSDPYSAESLKGVTNESGLTIYGREFADFELIAIKAGCFPVDQIVDTAERQGVHPIEALANLIRSVE
jgi:hypothetical protein